MKQLTAKQMAKVYRKGVDILESTTTNCCCGAIYDQFVCHGLYPSEVCSEYRFPELHLFSPAKGAQGYWWDMGDKEVRKVAFLFMEQIALDSKS